MWLILFGRVLLWKNVEKYGKTAVFPGGYARLGKYCIRGYGQIGVYRVMVGV